MQTHVLNCGSLKVRADEMIKPLTIEQISNTYNVDDKGYMKLGMNGLLVADRERVILIDPGCADFLPSRLAREYGLEITASIEEQLNKTGFDARQVTDVIFTHLHFDHGSGAFLRVPGKIIKRFPEARYHVSEEHYNYAKKPDPRESNSFFFSRFLGFIDQVHWLEEWKEDGIDFRVFNGHTRGMVVPVIKTPEGDICYVSDLIPLKVFLDAGVFSGYDLDPVLADHEKQEFLNERMHANRFIYFHEPLLNNEIYP